MNWMQRMMMGRYGGDQMGIGILILSMVINFVPFWPARIVSIPVSYTHLPAFGRMNLFWPARPVSAILAEKNGVTGGDKPPPETDLARAGGKRKKSGGIPPLFYCSRMRK